MYRSKMQVRLSDVYHDFTSVIGENVRAVALGKIRKVLEQKEGGGGAQRGLPAFGCSPGKPLSR